MDKVDNRILIKNGQPTLIPFRSNLIQFEYAYTAFMCSLCAYVCMFFTFQ